MKFSGKVQGSVALGEAPETSEGPDEREVQLVALAREGSESAWEELVYAQQDAVFRLAFLMLSRGSMKEAAAEAEDVAQETFVRAYLNLAQFDSSRPLRPWLLGITANLARNRRRSLGRYWSAVQRWLRNNPERLATDAGHEQRQQDELLGQAVQELRPAMRETVYLYYFLELSEAETAEALSIAPGTVKSRLYRARHELKAIIKAEFPALYADWRSENNGTG